MLIIPVPLAARGQHAGEPAQHLPGQVPKFVEFGTPPGAITQYERLDGKGGFVIQEADNPEGIKENLLRYAPWIEFDVFPITTMVDAFPLIQRVYG